MSRNQRLVIVVLATAVVLVMGCLGILLASLPGVLALDLHMCQHERPARCRHARRAPQTGTMQTAFSRLVKISWT
jgi:hypothetical protein